MCCAVAKWHITTKNTPFCSKKWSRNATL